MSYSLATLWHERQRFLPGVLAIAFSALLIALQCGLLLGLFSVTSIPIDHTRADLWVGAPDLLSVDLGRPIPESHVARLANQPEVESVETYMQAFAYWAKPNGGSELCIVIGSRVADDSMGWVHELTPELRTRLSEPGAIVVDESELERLGLHGVGDHGEILGRKVRVVGLVRGLKSIAGPYVFCSIPTAKSLVRMPPAHTTYLLARCRNPEDAVALAARLRDEYGGSMSVFTSREFSFRSQMHWLMKTKAGIAMGYAALLGLLVGVVVTSQTLYAAVTGSLREYAVLRALGIPRWRMGMTVVAQSFWVGISGVLLAWPTVFVLARIADAVGVRVDLPWWLLAAAGSVTLSMAVLSGLTALRSLRLVEPAILLR